MSFFYYTPFDELVALQQQLDSLFSNHPELMHREVPHVDHDSLTSRAAEVPPSFRVHSPPTHLELAHAAAEAGQRRNALLARQLAAERRAGAHAQPQQRQHAVRHMPIETAASAPAARTSTPQDLAVARSASWAPKIDVRENDAAIFVHAELPGVNKDDIHVDVEDGVLSLSGEREQKAEQKDDRWHYVERSYGSFRRSFRLPDNVNADAIKASYVDGVLNVELPKIEPPAGEKRRVSVE